MEVQLTDIREIAKLFYNSSVIISNYRFSNWENLSNSELDELESFESRLRNQSSKFIAMTIDLSINEISDSIKQINNSIISANECLTHLKKIKSIITTAKKIIILGNAIMNMNVLDILNATTSLFENSKEIE